MDTVFSTGDGSYYVFKGADYWRLTDDSVAPGYPRKIAEDWPGKILCNEQARYDMETQFHNPNSFPFLAKKFTSDLSGSPTWHPLTSEAVDVEHGGQVVSDVHWVVCCCVLSWRWRGRGLS